MPDPHEPPADDDPTTLIRSTDILISWDDDDPADTLDTVAIDVTEDTAADE